MKREDWRSAYEPLPEALSGRVACVLSMLDAAKPVKKHPMRTAVIALAVLLALGGVAYALIDSRTADIFGWFYGNDKKEELLSGDIAPAGQTCQLGQVVYTLEEVVYKDGCLYGTGTIRPADGANVVLIAEDYGVNDPAGYLLHYGDEEVPGDAPTYAQLAEERNAKIVLAKCIPNGALNPDGSLNASEIGYAELPQADGTILFTFEFEGGAAENGAAVPDTIVRAGSYTLSLYLANWEVTTDGLWLREEPDDTWLRTDWTVTVTPTMKGA